MDVFQQYKPIRNKIATLSIEEALGTIWAYCQFLQIDNFTFPPEVEVPNSFLISDFPQEWISEWDLELLAKEVVLNGSAIALKGRVLRAWKNLSGLIGAFRTLENEIYGQFGSSDSILTELVPMQRFSEFQYFVGKAEKRTVDWIVADEDAALFIECKAKRLSWGAKISLTDLRPLETDIENMAAAIVQVYKTIIDHLNDAYTHFPAECDRKIFPLVVTLENWQMFGPRMTRTLEEAVIQKLNKASISLELIEDMPFSVWGVEELEVALQIMKAKGIAEFMEGKLRKPDMRDWAWHGYMTSNYPSSFPAKKLFASDYHDMFSGLFR